MMVFSPEANEKNVRLFLTSLREVLEGKRFGSTKSLKAPDHRRSASYKISESEALVFFILLTVFLICNFHFLTIFKVSRMFLQFLFFLISVYCAMRFVLLYIEMLIAVALV